MQNEIKRGDIYWVDWTPSRGSEQKGVRPSLVIQNNIGNIYSNTVIVATITTAIKKKYGFIVNINKNESGLPQDSAVNLSAILTIDKNCLGEKCGELNYEKMLEINEAIKISLGLS